MVLQKAINTAFSPALARNRFPGVSLFTLALIAAALSGCSSSPSLTETIQDTSQGGVTIKFQNLRPDAAKVPAYISFGGGGALDGTNLADGTPLTKGTPYLLSSLTAGVNIASYDSGRIYLSLQSPLITPNAGNGFAPNFNNPNLDDFSTRWDKIELTIAKKPDGTSGGVNLTSQDFFGLPLDVVTTGGTQAPAHLTWHADTLTVFSKLAALSNYGVITKQNATYAIAVGDNGVTVPGVKGGDVIRIISPGSVAPITAGGQTVYQSLAGYVSYLQTGNPTNPGQPIQTQIAGHNGQIVNGGPFQTYNLTATVSNSSYTLGDVSISPGDLVFDGTVNNGDGGGDVHYTILVAAANMSDHGIYGANPAWKILVPTGAPDPNKIVEKVTADYFAALNFGFVGSTANNANMPNSTIGASPSWTWYGNQPSGQPAAKLPISAAFGAAQPQNSDRYNQFADYLVGVTDSYGFAYNDRLELPLAAVSDGTIVQVTILPDSR